MEKTIVKTHKHQDLMVYAMEEGCNYQKAELFADYVVWRKWGDESIDYLICWAKRFAGNEEWNRSDYAGRKNLRLIRPDKYPSDLDEVV